MVQFLSINFFSWISSIFVGFFKSFRFFVSPCTCDVLLYYLDLFLMFYVIAANGLYCKVFPCLVFDVCHTFFFFSLC